MTKIVDYPVSGFREGGYYWVQTKAGLSTIVEYYPPRVNNYDPLAQRECIKFFGCYPPLVRPELSQFLESLEFMVKIEPPPEASGYQPFEDGEATADPVFKGNLTPHGN